MKISTILLCLSALMVVATAKDHKDQITSLPGLAKTPLLRFKQYSGYLPSLGNRLHYWFVESQSNPAKDPVVLWLNGGPGCSSLDGFLSEHGPFLLSEDGSKLVPNPYSWNTEANILYLEAPAGVGFSYAVNETEYVTDDLQTAAGNHQALVSFFNEFSEFRENDFYTSGESYGGVYVPSLTAKILMGNEHAKFKINLKGMLVGNGLLDARLNDNSLVEYAYYHGFIGEEVWAELKTCKGNFHDPTNPTCVAAVESAFTTVYESGINFYGWNSDCASNDARVKRSLSHLFSKLPIQRPENKTGLQMNVPCIYSKNLDRWLNRRDVREALHVEEDERYWTICRDEDEGLHYTKIWDNSTQFFPYILKAGVRALIYNGDTDMACNHLGNSWALQGLRMRELTNRTSWTVDGQVAGFKKEFKGLTYITVKGAGHMVPQPGIGKPEYAMHFLKNFLKGKPI